MIEEIRADALERQIARVGNAKWEEIFPDVMPVDEIIGYTNASVERLDHFGKKIVSFMMALGRLMDVASKKDSEEWKATPYGSFTDFEEQALAKIRSHGSRYTALRMYRNLKDVPMEQLEKCPVGNLNQAARLIQSHPDYSPEQRRELLESAAKPRAEFEQEIQQKALVPPGEESMRSVLVKGHRADAEYLSAWLEREDIVKLGGTEIERILCAAAELDSTGPNVVLASVILREIAMEAERLGAWETLLDETFAAKVKAWLSQGTPKVDQVVDVEFQES